MTSDSPPKLPQGDISGRADDRAAAREAGPDRSGHRSALLAGSVGNLIEWFVWSVYGYFASFFSASSSRAGSVTASLLLSFSVFAVGFFMRPLGGLLLGAFGDQRGRRATLILTVGLLKAGSLMLAVLPPYSSIGVAAPLLLLVARLMQDFSAGEEFGSSAAFLVEHARPGRGGLGSSVQQVTVVIGLLIGSVYAAVLTRVPSHDEIVD